MLKGKIFTSVALLPHNSSIVIKDIIQKHQYILIMKSLISLFHEAIVAFEEDKFNLFDAQVGETLCQVRAYKIYELSKSSLFKSNLAKIKKKIGRTNESLEEKDLQYQCYLKIHKSQRPEEFSKVINICDFFSELNCNFSISKDLFFVFISYFLCQYNAVNEDGIPISINVTEVEKSINISRTYAKKIVHYYQQSLAELSCHFIFELLGELPESNYLCTILPLFYMQSDEGRMVLPCHVVTEIIMLHMIKNKANLLLLINVKSKNQNERLALLFKGTESGEFEYMSNQELEHRQPCMVMYGEHVAIGDICLDNFFTKILSCGVKELLLLNNAAHPQFSGKTLSCFRDDPYQAYLSSCSGTKDFKVLSYLSNELQRKKKLANALGCSEINRGLFFLKHVFCNSIVAYKEYFS